MTTAQPSSGPAPLCTAGRQGSRFQKAPRPIQKASTSPSSSVFQLLWSESRGSTAQVLCSGVWSQALSLPLVPDSVLQPACFLSGHCLLLPASPGSAAAPSAFRGASSNKDGQGREGAEPTGGSSPPFSPVSPGCHSDSPASAGPCPQQSALQPPHKMSASQGQRVFPSGSGPGTPQQAVD